MSGQSLLWGYLLVLNLNLMTDILVEAGWYRPTWWPVTLWHSLNTYLLMGPVLYFLGRTLVGERRLRTRYVLLHASPFLIGLVYQFTTLDFELYGGALFRQSELEVVNRFNPQALFTAAHFSVYLAATGWLGANFWASQRKRWPRELQLLVSAVSLSMVMMTSILVATVTAMVLEIDKSFGFVAGSALGVILMEAWLIWLLLAQEKTASTPASSGVEPEDALAGELQQLLRENKPFLDAEWNAAALATQLKVTRHQLSAAIARIEPEGFYALINRLRIEEVKQRIKAQPDRQLIQIAYDCGFNSKSTFNQVFKKYTGKTPSQFRAEVKELQAS